WVSCSVRENGPADSRWENIVEIEVQLHDPPNLAAGSAIDWNLCLRSDLEVTAGPNEARIYGARCAARAPIEQGRHRKFDQGNELVEHRIPPGALDVGIEVRDAVFDGKTPLELVGVLLDD